MTYTRKSTIVPLNKIETESVSAGSFSIGISGGIIMISYMGKAAAAGAMGALAFMLQIPVLILAGTTTAIAGIAGIACYGPSKIKNKACSNTSFNKLFTKLCK